MTQKRPQPGDYAAAYESYIAIVPSGDFLALLEEQPRELLRRLEPLSEEQAGYRYAPEKWTIKEVVGHLSDAERILAYRLLRIARGDRTPLPSFEENAYVRTGNFASRKLTDLLGEFSTVRAATVRLVGSLDDASWLRRGVANQNEISALAVAFVIAGHFRHHQLILEERYLPGLRRV